MGLIRSATIAAASTSAAIVALSTSELGHPAAALNAVSQMIWGPSAVDEDDASLKYTAVGAACMSGALAGWSVIATVLAGRRPSTRRAVAAGIAAAGLAYAIDYHVVPARLRPGIELRLSKPSVILSFTALAGGLIAGQLLRRR